MYVVTARVRQSDFYCLTFYTVLSVRKQHFPLDRHQTWCGGLHDG